MQYILPMEPPVPEIQIAELPDINANLPLDLDPFLQTEASFGIATEAYETALQALQSTLSPTELASVQLTTSVEELYAVAERVESLCSRLKNKGRLQSLVEVLDHYSPILDVLSQSHSDYTALLWGSIKWLLQVTMNYFRLLKRLSTMLEEIGDNLPRFMLYERILPTNHMFRIISKLYAAIIQFLYEAIAFWKRHKVRKFVVAFWSPFEVKFSDTMEKIHRLQECVEKDAIATEMAQRRRDTVRFEGQLRELSLITRHTLQSVLEVKERQTILLLMTIRQQLFTPFDCKSEYQEECIQVYSAFMSTAWEETMQVEAQFSSWHHTPHSRLTYVQAEALEPVLTVAQLLYDRKFSQDVKRVILFWGAGMTKESALAALIFGILTKHADKLLYREMSGFYAEKFGRCSPAFEQLWTIFTEMMSVLPELHCTIHVASYEPQATDFVARLVKFALQSRHGKLDLLIYHTTVNALSSTPGWVELDNDYDVDFDVNACDSFFRLVLLEANCYEDLSDTMQTYMWMTTWRSLRYNLMALTFHQTCHIIRPEMRQHDGKRLLPSFKYESRSHQQAAALLKRRVIAFLQLIPIEMSPEKRQQLRTALNVSNGRDHAIDSVSENDEQNLGPRSKAQPISPDFEERTEIWANIQAQFEEVISEIFENKILDILEHTDCIDDDLDIDVGVEASGSAHLSIQQMEMVGGQVFCQDRWSVEDLTTAQTRLEQVLLNGARTGLMLTQQVVFPL